MTSPIESSTPTGQNIPYTGIPQNNPGQNWYRKRDPGVHDFKNYQVLDRWLNTATRTAFWLTAKAGGVSTWIPITGASAGLQTLTGDAGGAISPLAGNINILGTATQTTVTGTPNTLTISLPTTLVLGSVAGAAGTSISVGTGNFLLQGAATSTITIGTGLTTGTTLIGGTAQTGTITLGSSSGVNIVNVGTGTGATTVNVATGITAAKTVNIGTGAAMANTITVGGTGANVITIGDAQTAGSIAMGTAMTTGTISIGGTGLQTGTISIAPGTGAQIVNIGTGAVGIKSINIGTGAIDNAIIIGTVTGTAATTIRAGSGGITLTGNAGLTGNLTLVAAGNKINRTSVATIAAAGANSMGSVVLVGGTVSVATTAVTANSLIKIWRQSVGATGAAALGQLSVGTIVAATSFDINAWSAADATALQASDVSVIGWEIVN
jgi:hypothetical protein